MTRIGLYVDKHRIDSPYLTIDQAAARGQFCRDTILKAMKQDGLKFIKVGRLIRIRVTDFDKWMDAKIVGGIHSVGGLSMDGWTE